VADPSPDQFRKLQVYLRLTSIGIAYCHVDQGCRFAVEGLPSINGIARAPPGVRVGGQDIFYAAGYGTENRIFVLEKQGDESLVLVDTIDIGALLLSKHYGGLTGGIGGTIDNLTVAPDGTVYATGELGCIQDVSTLTPPQSISKRASFYWYNDSEPSRKYQPIIGHEDFDKHWKRCVLWTKV
jgi:hypothetical protein